MRIGLDGARRFNRFRNQVAYTTLSQKMRRYVFYNYGSGQFT